MPSESIRASWSISLLDNMRILSKLQIVWKVVELVISFLHFLLENEQSVKKALVNVGLGDGQYTNREAVFTTQNSGHLDLRGTILLWQQGPSSVPFSTGTSKLTF